MCCISFVSFASFSRSFFVRPTYLRIQGRMQILRFWTEIFKNEVLQRWGGLHSTQNKKCYIEMGLNFWGVSKKCRLRPANFAFRILVPMSMVIFLGAKPCERCSILLTDFIKLYLRFRTLDVWCSEININIGTKILMEKCFSHKTYFPGTPGDVNPRFSNDCSRRFRF